MTTKREPANGAENAVAIDIMRAALTTLVGRRHGPVVIRKRDRRKFYGVMLRMRLERDDSITLWIEPGEPEAKLGVTYVADPAEGPQP